MTFKEFARDFGWFTGLGIMVSAIVGIVVVKVIQSFF